MYEKIYSVYSAQDEIEKGKTVFVLDKLTKDVFELGDVSVKRMLEIKSEEDITRFEMWVEKEVEEVENGND